MQRTPPAFRWYGGKTELAKKIIALMPNLPVYVEPYGGAASVLLARKPAKSEVYNDLSLDVVNFFRMLQDKEKRKAIRMKLAFTPFAKAEYLKALDILRTSTNLDERSWALFVAQNQSLHHAHAQNPGDWARSKTSTGGMANDVSRWWKKMGYFSFWIKRFARVQIDCNDAFECIKYWDSKNTLFYIDPPYVTSTRQFKKRYKFEYTDAQHRALVRVLLSLEGAVVLSGYNTSIYAELELKGWDRKEFVLANKSAGVIKHMRKRGKGSGAMYAPREEIIWRNPYCIMRKEEEKK